MRILAAMFLLIRCIDTPPPEQARSPLDPHPTGMPVVTTITFGDAYSTAIEAYDARITVIEVLRGEKAWELLTKQNASNRKPDSGFEYVLARIRFEFAAKGKPGDKNYELREGQFEAFSSDASIQYPLAHAVPPNPRLAGTLHSGDSAEGWIVLTVAREDQTPVMVFRADVRFLSHSGIGPAFRLD
jgi:hypothetical protein